jgi:hypothetical protein
MTSMLSRAIATLRVWLGFNDPSENHPHAAHGWLLPPVALARARTPARAAVPHDRLKPGRQQ